MIRKNSFNLAFIYTGTILGAGFASGKELVSFFAKYKKLGLMGFFISCFLLSISFMAILDLIKNSNAKDYKGFLIEVFGKKLALFLQFLNILFLFTIFSAMLAGGATSLNNILNINLNICLIIFFIVVFFSLFFGEKAVVFINAMLCPLLIIGGIFLGIYIEFFLTKEAFSLSQNFLTSSIIYTSYNIITTISVLFGVRRLIINNKVVVLSGLLGGLFIFFIGLFLVLSLIDNYEIIKFEALPILHIIKNEIFIKNIYTLIILMAIYTTAIGNGFALENIIYEKYNKNKFFIRALITILGLLASLVGFSNMVEKVYPIFGYLGLFQLLVIFILFYLKKKPFN